MQPLIALLLLLGFCLLLIFGLLSVLQDLLERNFHPDPGAADAPADSPAAKLVVDAEHSVV
jgi:hypothetical protein